MAIRIYKSITPGTRNRSVSDFTNLTKKKPEKSLLTKRVSKAGRNNRGKITVRHRGGGHKQRYRIIDFKRNKDDIAATVERIEYDPNRSANIALVLYADGERRYIIAPKGVNAGDQVISGNSVAIQAGNTLPLSNIPLGSVIHCVELKPQKGAQIARSAGTSAQVVAKEGKFVTLKMPSNEVRMVHSRCYATIGEVGNAEEKNLVLGKAGRKRWLGIRPTVRGVVMNPVSITLMVVVKVELQVVDTQLLLGVSPALGIKTRRNNKYSDFCIIRKRK